MEKKLIISFGSKENTLNRGEEHFTLTDEELAFIVESAIKNGQINIQVKPSK